MILRFDVRPWLFIASLVAISMGRGAAQSANPPVPAPGPAPDAPAEPEAPTPPADSPGETPPSDAPAEAPPADAPVESETPADVEAEDADAEPGDDAPVEAETDAALEDGEATPVEDEPLGLSDEDYEDLEVEGDSDIHIGTGYLELTPEDVFTSSGSVAAVSEQELTRLGYTDPSNVVQRIPGVTVRVEDGFGLRPNIAIRGTNPERSRSVTLMEDGVLFGPAPYSAPAAYFFPLVARMTGVEVYKGPAAILYGPQTVGGAVNFLARDVPTTPGGEVRLGYGSYGNRLVHAHYGFSNARAGALVEVLDLGSRGFKNIDGTEDESGFARTEAILRGFVQSSTSRRVYHRLDARVSYSRERSNETYLGLTEPDFAADPDRRYVASADDVMRWQRFGYRLDHRLETDEVTLLTTLYRHDFERLWHRFDSLGAGAPAVNDILLAPDAGNHPVFLAVLTGAQDSDPAIASQRVIAANNDRAFVSQGAQSTLTFDRRRGRIHHQLRAGLRFHYDEIVRHHSSESYLVANRQLVRDDSPELATRNEKAFSYAVAMFGSYAFEIGRLRLTPGGRVEMIRSVLDNHGVLADRSDAFRDDGFSGAVLGGFGANYQVIDELAVFAGVHRGFSPVAPGSAGVADPELSTNFELGARLRDEDRGVRLEAAAFANDYSNLLLSCSGAGGCPAENVDKQFNAGGALIMGLEVAYAHELDLPGDYRMPLTATYAYQRSRFLDQFTSVDPQYRSVDIGDEVPYLPHHQATVAVGVEHERFRANATGTFVSKMREQAGHGDTGLFTDPQAFLDVSGEVRVHGRVHLTLRLENVTNSRPIVAHIPFGARPYRPFMATAGLRIEL